MERIIKFFLVDLKRNVQDKVFKNRDNLAQFYYDLTAVKIKPKEIIYDSIATSIVKGHEEDIAFQIGNRYIILIEAQSTWKSEDVLRFAYYRFVLFLNYIDQNSDSFFENNEEIPVPIVEAYVIYTGNANLPEIVSLHNFFPDQENSMINAEMKIVSFHNAIGMVREYIDFSKLETKYYSQNRRNRNDVLELINYCIKNNILKNYLKKHKSEVTNLIEDFFTEERRIQRIVNEAVSQAILEEHQKLEKTVNEAILEERQKNMKSQII